MESLPIQPADAVVPTLPESAPSTGAPAGDAIFAMTLGRALDSLPGPNHGEESITPKSAPTYPRTKIAATDSNDATLVAGAIFNFFVTDPSTPASPVAPDIDAAGSAVGLPIPSDAPAGACSPRLILMGNPTTDQNGGAFIDPKASGGAGAQGPVAFGADGNCGLWGSPKLAANGVARRGRTPSASPMGNSAGLPGSNLPQGTATNQPGAWVPAMPTVTVPGPLPLPTPTPLPSGPEPVADADPKAAQNLGTRQESQAPANFRPSWKDLGTTTLPPAASGMEVREIPILPQELPMIAGLPASSSGPASGEGHQAPAAPEVAAATSAPSFDPDDRLSLRAFSNPPKMPAGAAGQAAPPAGPTSFNTVALVPEIDPGSLSTQGTDNPELTAHVSLGEKSAGAAGPAASNLTPAPGMLTGIPVAPLDASPAPAAAKVLTLLGTMAGPGATLQVTGSDPSEPTEKSPSGTSLVPTGAPDGGHEVAVDGVRTSAPSEFQFAPNDLTKNASPSAQGSLAPDAPAEKNHRGETSNAQAVPLTAPSPVPFPPHANSHMDASANISPATETGGGRQGAAAVSTSGTGGAHPNLLDSSPDSQGKSAPQNGGAPGNSPASVSSFTHSALPDPSINILGAHQPSPPPTSDDATALRTPPPAAHTPTTLSAWQSYEGGAGSIVRAASLGDSALGSEMHVEFRSGSLGPLEVHAVMREGSVGAEIHVQGQEAHTLLAAGLPSLERALGERNLRVENLAVYQDHAGGGMSGGDKHGSQSGSSPSPQHQVLPWDNPAQRVSPSVPENEELNDPESGLSVRA